MCFFFSPSLLPLDAHGPEEYKAYMAVWSSSSSSSSCAQCSFLPDSFIHLLLKNWSEAASPAATVPVKLELARHTHSATHSSQAGGGGSVIPSNPREINYATSKPLWFLSSPSPASCLMTNFFYNLQTFNIFTRRVNSCELNSSGSQRALFLCLSAFPSVYPSLFLNS